MNNLLSVVDMCVAAFKNISVQTPVSKLQWYSLSIYILTRVILSP